jgi:hypothetical protein
MDNPNAIVVEVRGGTVVGVYSEQVNVRVVLIDWDEIEETGHIEGTRYSHIPLNQLPQKSLEVYRSAS